ncbi:MAG: NAD+ synthase [Candidatus Calescibacterium sp.]|nr:NAD+ synthase [Candidatus Calescibacterium sp.]MDW8194905.1 NAD+ synthase [Candidatus Calescibacterium sp.]
MLSTKLSLCQINPIVGDIKHNFEKIISSIEKNIDSSIICFPELSLIGCPPEDILSYPYLIQEQYQYLEKLKSYSRDKIIVLGFVNFENAIYNSAAIIENNNIWIYNKVHLSGVFDEDRYFKSGEHILIIQTSEGIRIGVTVSEDIWYPTEPLQTLIVNGVDIVINISASPYHVMKPFSRENMLKVRASDYSVFIVFCNLVGGQDEIVFDGTSSVISNYGRTIARAPSFKEYHLDCIIPLEELKLAKLGNIRKKISNSKDLFLNLQCKTIKSEVSIAKNMDYKNNEIYDFLTAEEEIFQACVLGTRDYIVKNNFKKVLVAMSGGIDSSLVTCIASEAIGPENVLGISMPSMFSSSHSIEDAKELAKNLRINFEIIPIIKIYDSFIDSLNDIYTKFGSLDFSIAEENLQSRIRATIIMTLSNKFGHLVLACGNKSEMSVGYATLYGDLAGGFAPIKDLYKTEVYRVSRYYNSKNKVIPERVFIKPPSAELRPNQVDQDSLPPYEILDPILQLYLENNLSPYYISQKLGLDVEFIKKIIRDIENAEYKRRQAPPGVKITPRSFGKDRRLPITKKII